MPSTISTSSTIADPCSKYLSFEEFADQHPGIPCDYYDALKRGKQLVRLGNGALHLCDTQKEISDLVDSHKQDKQQQQQHQCETWTSSSLVRLASPRTTSMGGGGGKKQPMGSLHLDPYLTFAECCDLQLGLDLDSYQAVLQRNMLFVRINQTETHLCHDQVEVARVIGKSERFKVWSKSSLLRESWHV